MTTLSSYTPHRLIGGDKKLTTEDVRVASGDLSIGSVMGRVKVSVPTTGTAGTNTGNGTVTAVSGGKDTKRGTYTIKNIVAITNGGTFSVTDPDGKFVGVVVITAGAGGTGVFKSDEINFTITDGSTDFVLADSFTVAVTDGVPTTGTADGGNTGNGTVTAVEGRSQLKVGTYTIACVTAVANGGVFTVSDPDGYVIQTATMTVGAGAATAVDGNGQIAFTLTDGSTDFVAGDSFTIAVTSSPRTVKLLDKTATDGSNVPYGVLAGDVDASSAAKAGVVYRTGQFVESQLIFASGTDVEDVRDAMEAQGMFIVTAVDQNEI